MDWTWKHGEVGHYAHIKGDSVCINGENVCIHRGHSVHTSGGTMCMHGSEFAHTWGRVRTNMRTLGANIGVVVGKQDIMCIQNQNLQT